MTNFSITSNVQSITPQLAADILQGNTLNRPLNHNTVMDYVAQMKAGKWKLNGEPIIIAKDGRLLDGQHRLQAVVESGVAIPAVIVYNVDPETFSTIDTGKVRTAGDIFSIDGIENAAQKAAAVSAYFRLVKKMKGGQDEIPTSDMFKRTLRQFRISKAEILEFYGKNKNLIDNLIVVSSKCDRKLRLMTQSVICAYIMYLVLDKNHPLEKVASFFYQLCGVEYTGCKTITIFRDILLKNLSKQKIITNQLRHIFLVKTWNSFITGKELSVLQYHAGREKANIDFV